MPRPHVTASASTRRRVTPAGYPDDEERPRGRSRCLWKSRRAGVPVPHALCARELANPRWHGLLRHGHALAPSRSHTIHAVQLTVARALGVKGLGWSRWRTEVVSA